MMRCGHYLLLTLLVAASGCARAGKDPRRQVYISDWYPLEVGNTWKLRSTKNDQQRIVRVVSHTVIEGQPCAVVRTKENGTLIGEEVLSSTRDGVFVVASGDLRHPKPIPLLRLPPYEGRSWRVRFRKHGRITEWRFSVNHEEVTVPYGSFSAIRLHTEIMDEGGIRRGYFTQWFSKGIGLVKQTLAIGNRPQEFELFAFAKGNTND